MESLHEIWGRGDHNQAGGYEQKVAMPQPPRASNTAIIQHEDAKRDIFVVADDSKGSPGLSVAFTKEDSAETAAETLLPERPVSPHPNLVTGAGLKALEFQLHQAREAYETAQKIEDVNERRRQAAAPLRDARYFAARVRTAQVIADPTSTDTVAFGSTVTFRRDDGRIQKYRIVGEDEADPKAGSISFVSPVARSLVGKAVGDVVSASGQELEIMAIA
jgi:transcription elongation GreA/GreB family factor